ncbi:MAG TPA: hypothetical protein PKA82_13150 [Pyrinomonadaceae bacterium]|nr:hypothetical protein [Pyrinomonadaceae bacterium]
MKKIFALYLLVTFAVFAAACGGAATNTSNNAAAKPATKADAPKADAPKTDAPKTDVAAGDSVGVAECDDYIKKYEACLTSIAAKAPQVEGPMKTAFQAQRDGFKKTAETPAGKATLKDVCTKAIETAKASTSMYACTW